MRVQDLMEVLNGGAEVFIKPNGMPKYYEGSVKEIPRCLLNATVIEISPQAYDNVVTDSIYKVEKALGIWVENIEELDYLYFGFGNLDSYKGKEIDAMYGFVMDNRERMMELLQEESEKNYSLRDRESDVPFELKWLMTCMEDIDGDIDEKLCKAGALVDKINPISITPISEEMLVEYGEPLDMIDILVDEDKKAEQKKKPTISKKTEEFIEKLRNKDNNVE